MDQHMVYIQIAVIDVSVPDMGWDDEDTSGFGFTGHLLDIVAAFAVYHDIQFIEAVRVVSDGILGMHKGFDIFMLSAAEAV